MALHPLALGIEQIRDAVQCDDGLAGARPALDDEHTGVVETDDRVLLGLDRGHDVAHPVAARGVDRGEQRHVRTVRLGSGVAVERAAEHLVGEVEQPASEAVELPAPAHALGVGAGGDVERPGRRRPPVQQQRFVLVRAVEQSDTADIEAFTVDGVQPPEAQPGVGDVEPVHLGRYGAHLGIAGQQGRAVLGVDVAAQGLGVPLLDPGPLCVQPGVEPVDVLAFGLQLGLVGSRVLS